MDVHKRPSLERNVWAGPGNHKHGALDLLGCGLDSNFGTSIHAAVVIDHRMAVCIPSVDVGIHPSLEIC